MPEAQPQQGFFHLWLLKAPPRGVSALSPLQPAQGTEVRCCGQSTKSLDGGNVAEVCMD